MISNKDIQPGIKVVHTRTGEVYSIFINDAQVKVDDGKWKPAVIYTREGKNYYQDQVFIRDTESFMANFELQTKVETE